MLAVTRFCTAIMGRGTIGGPRNRQHSWCFQEAGCLQVTSNSACPCLSALTKRKECFLPQHGCVGIKTHSEWPRVVQQMLARIVLVAVPTVSRRERPAQTTLSLCTCIGVKGGEVKGLSHIQKEWRWEICHFGRTISCALSLFVITHMRSYTESCSFHGWSRTVGQIEIGS